MIQTAQGNFTLGSYLDKNPPKPNLDSALISIKITNPTLGALGRTKKTNPNLGSLG